MLLDRTLCEYRPNGVLALRRDICAHLPVGAGIVQRVAHSFEELERSIQLAVRLVHREGMHTLGGFRMPHLTSDITLFIYSRATLRYDIFLACIFSCAA